MKRFLRWSGLSLAGLLALAVLVIAVLANRRYDAPLSELRASADPALIARGRYLAYGPAHCVTCHGDPGRMGAPAAAEVPLSGGMAFELPIGTFRPANLTADAETGIGAVSDGQLARALRHGIARDGRAMLPFMSFADLSDQDLTALLSFLRAQPPVKKPVRQREVNLLGRVVEALLIRPSAPTLPVRDAVPAGPTAAYGGYLVNAVANCAGCHTRRDPVTTAMSGPVLAGGLQIDSHSHPGATFVTPNLTPDPDTGRVARWTEEIFVARFRMGRGPDGTPMPWAAYARMSDEDLQAVWRYLQALPPVHNETGPSVPGPESSAAQAAR